MGQEISALAKAAFSSYNQTCRLDSFDDLLVALYSYTRALTYNVYGIRDPDQQKDVFQESALRFFKYLPTYDEERPFLPWWQGIVRSAALDFLKKTSTRQRHESSSEDEQLIGGSHVAWKDAKQSERKFIVQDLLSRLQPRDREILWMHYVDGLTAEEMSKVLGKSHYLTKYAIHRALKNLRKLFQSGPTDPKKANPQHGEEATGDAVS